MLFHKVKRAFTAVKLESCDREFIPDHPGGPSVKGLGYAVSMRGGDMMTDAEVGEICLDYGSQTSDLKKLEELRQ